MIVLHTGISFVPTAKGEPRSHAPCPSVSFCCPTASGLQIRIRDFYQKSVFHEQVHTIFFHPHLKFWKASSVSPNCNAQRSHNLNYILVPHWNPVVEHYTACERTGEYSDL